MNYREKPYTIKSSNTSAQVSLTSYFQPVTTKIPNNKKTSIKINDV